MITGIDKLCEWMQMHQCAYWRIYHGRAKQSHPLSFYDHNSSNSINTSIEDLRKVVELLSPGTYFIICNRDKQHTKENPQTVFVHVDMSGQVAGPEQQESAIGFNARDPEKYINEKVEIAINSFKQERRIEDLEREKKEMQLELRELQPTLLENRVSTLLPKIEPYIGGIMQKLGIQKDHAHIAVSGVDPDVESETETQTMTQEDVKEYNDKITRLIQDWAVQDENFLEVIEKLVALAKSDPPNYQKATKILDKALKNPMLFNLI